MNLSHAEDAKINWTVKAIFNEQQQTWEGEELSDSPWSELDYEDTGDGYGVFFEDDNRQTPCAVVVKQDGIYMGKDLWGGWYDPQVVDIDTFISLLFQCWLWATRQEERDPMNMGDYGKVWVKQDGTVFVSSRPENEARFLLCYTEDLEAQMYESEEGEVSEEEAKALLFLFHDNFLVI